MGLVSTWLKTVGLGHAVPAFRRAGINSPAALAQLEMSDYEELGITDWNDRRKLLYLVQRIQVARDDNEKQQRHEKYSEEEEEFYSHDEEDDELHSDEKNSQTPRTPSESAAAALAEWSAADRNEEHDEISSNSTLPSPPPYRDNDEYYQSEDEEDYNLKEEKMLRREEERNHIRSRGLDQRERSNSRRMRLLKTDPYRNAKGESRRHGSRHLSRNNNHDSSDQLENEDEEVYLYGRSFKPSGRDQHQHTDELNPSSEPQYSTYSKPLTPNSQRENFRSREISNKIKLRNKKEHHRRNQILKPLNSNENSFNNEHYQQDDYDSYDRDRSPSNSNLYESPASYENNDFNSEENSPVLEFEYRSRPSTSYSRPKSRSNRAQHVSSRNRRLSSLQPSLQMTNSTEQDYEESNRTYLYEKEEDVQRLSPSPPPARSTRRMSQRLKEKNVRTQMRRDLEKKRLHDDETSLHDDYSIKSRSDNYSRGKNDFNHRQEGGRPVRSHRMYIEEEDYDEEEFENDDDEVGEGEGEDEDEDDNLVLIQADRNKSNRRQSAILASPIVTSKIMERRRRSSSIHSTSSKSLSDSISNFKQKNSGKKILSEHNSTHVEGNSPREMGGLKTRSSYRETKDDFMHESEYLQGEGMQYSAEQLKSVQERSKQSKIPSFKSTASQRRRIQTKIQNPSVSLRNGNKMLSTIPSEKVAPMSPLVEIPTSDLKPYRSNKNESKLYELDQDTEIGSFGSEHSSGSGEDLPSTSSKEARGKSRKSNRRLSAPVAQSSHYSANSFEEDTSFLNKNTSIKSYKVSRRTSTGSLSSQSTSSRRSLGGRSLSASSINQSALSPRSAKSGPSRKLLRPLSKQNGPDSDKKDDKNSYQPVPDKKNEPSSVFVHGVPEDDSWSTQVSRLREDAADDYSEHGYENDQGCEEDEAMEMRIRVVVRKRPMSKKEANINDVDIIHPKDCNGFGRVAVYQPKTRVDLTKEVETLKFSFDNVFDENKSNSHIYSRAVRNLIPGVFEGQWASIFAYGQTGSGKTFTMMGCGLTGSKAGTQSKEDTENQGLYYLAAQDVFHLAKMEQYKHLSVGVSLFEIYGGKLFDLLSKRKAIKCLEDHKGKVCFPGLSEHPISNPNQLVKMIEAGALNRSTGVTSANADSSRSHAVLMLSLRKRVGRRGNVEHGRLSFIDLAGSERGADTAKACRTTRMEGAEINTSLLALKEVIRALATGDSMKHIPFRGSKLTQVLKESFVGKNSRTVMVACVAPNMNNCDHTLNTLRYADRVKERDPETGKLSEKVKAASKIVKKVSTVSLLHRPSTAPATSLEKKMSMKRMDESKSPIKIPPSFDDEIDEDVEWSSEDDEEDQSVYSGNDRPQSVEKQVFDSNSEKSLQEIANENDSKMKNASNALINTHRNVMTDMLNTVKHEMTLVNHTDADRNTINDYLVDLEQVLASNSSMITTLRQALMEYYAARGEVGAEKEKESHLSNRISSVIEDDGLLSDDSFEDLRD